MENTCIKTEAINVKAEELVGLINGMENVLVIRWGNVLEDNCESKFMFDFKAIQEDGQVKIVGKSYNDYEEVIDENFTIHTNEVFDAYYTDAEQEQNISINKFECGAYIDIQEEF